MLTSILVICSSPSESENTESKENCGHEKAIKGGGRERRKNLKVMFSHLC